MDITKENFEHTVLFSSSKAEVIRKLNLSHYRVFDKLKRKWQVNCDHFLGQAHLKNKTYKERYSSEKSNKIKQKLSISRIGKGSPHTEETKRILSEKRTKYLESSPHIKWYIVDKIKVQGDWERNVALTLLSMNFSLDRFAIKYDGHRRYTPDFYIKELDIFIEVKGWFRDRDKIKYNRFFKDNPNIKILLIGKDQYHDFISGNLKIEDLPSLADVSQR